jgi:serine phosphatase RsbU (regulator of sigma subunit)
MRGALSRFTSLSFFNTSLQALVRELPLPALLPLVMAVALLFSVMGPVTDLLDGARQPVTVVIRNAVLAGVIAVGYAFGSMRRNYLIFGATGLVHVLWIIGSRRLGSQLVPLPLSNVPDRLTFDALAILLAMTGSYAFFLRFINVTAARYLRVRAEIDLAREIHQVLVPAVQTTIGRFEFFGFSHPSGEVGGDLVDVVALPGGGWFGYVADVSGHGVSSGVVMGMFKSALRMRLLTGAPIAALLADLNTVLLPLKSSSMFITMACVRASPDGSLEYAVAGHLPILRVSSPAAATQEITTPQIPVGMFEDYAFTSAPLTSEPGELFALITDGLTEVFDRRDRELGIDAAKQLLQQSASLPLAEIADRIVSAARAHGAQLDDQTLLLIRNR